MWGRHVPKQDYNTTHVWYTICSLYKTQKRHHKLSKIFATFQLDKALRGLREEIQWKFKKVMEYKQLFTVSLRTSLMFECHFWALYHRFLPALCHSECDIVELQINDTLKDLEAEHKTVVCHFWHFVSATDYQFVKACVWWWVFFFLVCLSMHTRINVFNAENCEKKTQEQHWAMCSWSALKGLQRQTTSIVWEELSSSWHTPAHHSIK